MQPLVLLQARMASTRLPGKVLLPLGPAPLVAWPLARLARLGTVVLCTSDAATDGPLAETYPSTVRGSEADVLGRFILALGRHPDHEVLIRATGDNPLVLPELAQAAIATLLEEGADYCSIEGSALGTTVEVLTAEALRKISVLAIRPEEREHATLGILRRPNLFRIARFVAPPGYRSDLRLTIDTPTDYAWMCALVDGLGADPMSADWTTIARAAEGIPRVATAQARGAEVQELKEAAWSIPARQ